MGTYLSQPNREKHCEEGEDLRGDLPAAWGVVDMQGWRKTMEDAHFASAGVQPPGTDLQLHTRDAKTMVFAVFDGHGGPEVARFCQLYLLDVLTKQDYWNCPNPDIGKALIACFHALDRMIDDPNRRDEIMNLKAEKPGTGEYRTIQSDPVGPIGGDSFSDEKKIDVLNSVFLSERLPGSDTQTIDNGLDNDHYQECFSEEIPTHDDTHLIDKEDIHHNPKGQNSLIDVHSQDEVEDSAEEEDDDDDNCDILNEDVGEQAVALFKQLLYMNSSSSSSQDKGIVHFEPTVSHDGVSRQNLMVNENTPVTPSDHDNVDGRSVFQPTRIINGKQACNLPEHPIHAGCTAICAVIAGGILTVANAGDSRAVLCRAGGVVEPLSFDHKPTQERELNRIVEAGGFVNQFGRVNGNLNLSRSIGDLKYKQVPGIPPSGQMITAEPDITQLILNEKDEFIILGCDGIWDCLTNEEAVAFVRQRIDFKTPIEIGVEMLDTIVSVDPRTTQGIGGDNMTIMIIDLMPQKRPYRNSITG